MSIEFGDILELHERGELPDWLLTAFVVKALSKQGQQSDFDNMPNWLKEAVRKRLDEYKATEGWLLFGSNSEAEDYAPYADEVMRKIQLGG